MVWGDQFWGVLNSVIAFGFLRYIKCPRYKKAKRTHQKIIVRFPGLEFACNW